MRPAVVLDPFLGSGTSACVALSLGRHCWGIDLSEQYLRFNAVPRITARCLAVPALRHLVPRPAPKSLHGDDE